MSKGKLVSPEGVRQERHKSLSLIYLFIVVIVLGGLLATSIFLAKSESFYNPEIMEVIDVDHELVKVLLTEGEIGTQEFRVMNVGQDSEDIVLSSNLGNLLSFSESSFTLDSGQTKVLDLSFNSIVEGSGVEYQVGVYSGYISVKASDNNIQVPVAVDIESEEVLFDNSFELTNDNFDAGDEFNLPIRVFNLVSQDATNVLLEYFVIDANGGIVFSGEETVLVDTQLSTTKTISLSNNLNDGEYVLGVSVTYGDSTGVSSSVITIGTEEEVSSNIFEGDNFFMILSGILLVFFLFFVSVLVYKFFKKDEVQVEKKKVVKQDVAPLFDRSLLVYLFIAVGLFVGILFVIFFAGFLTYSGLVEILLMIPSSVYLVFLVLLIIFVVLLILKSVQNLRSRYYYHEVDRLKKQMEIEKYKKNLVGLQEKAREAKEEVKKKRREEGRTFSILRALHLVKTKEEIAEIKRKEKLKIQEEIKEKRRLDRERLKNEKEEAYRIRSENRLKQKIQREKELEKQRKLEEKEKKSLERKKLFSGIFSYVPNKLKARRERKEKERIEKEKRKVEEEKLLAKQVKIKEQLRKREEKKELQKEKQLERAAENIRKLSEKEEKKRKKLPELKELPEIKEKEVVEELPELEEIKPQIELPLEEYNVEIENIDPWVKVNDLLMRCYQGVSKKDLGYVELNYNQIKPLFLRLERWQKQKVYPKLIDIQNDMTMLDMNKLREGLRKKKKKK